MIIGIQTRPVLKKRLSVCIATCEDYDGLFFTIQSLRLNNPICLTQECEFIILDNAPHTEEGKESRKLAETIGAKYFGFADPQSSWNKYKAINFAAGEVILGLDSHVLLQPGAVERILSYFESNPKSKDLIQGQLLYDSLDCGPIKLKREFSGHMLGIWDENLPILDATFEQEIPAMGMGMWSIRRKAWKGISPFFKGFGGEEFYISEKVRQWGGKNICLGGCGWHHRFARPRSVPFTVSTNDRIFNYFIAALDLYKDENHPFIWEITQYFISEGIKEQSIKLILQEAKELVL